jgi:hypothetical protein
MSKNFRLGFELSRNPTRIAYLQPTLESFCTATTSSFLFFANIQDMFHPAMKSFRNDGTSKPEDRL